MHAVGAAKVAHAMGERFRIAGVTAIGAGVAVAAVGVGLALWARNHSVWSAQPPRVAFGAAPLPGGAAASFGAAF